RTPRAREPRAEARDTAYDAEEDLFARTAAAVTLAGAEPHGNQNVEAGGDDDEGDDDAERARVDECRGARAEVAGDDGARANRHGEAPVDAAAAVEEPSREQPGEEEAEERGGGGLVN